VKYWIVFALMLQSSFAFADEACLIAENPLARKKIACIDFAHSVTNEFVVEFSSPDWVTGVSDSAVLSPSKGVPEKFVFESYTAIDSKTNELKMKKSESDEWIKVIMPNRPTELLSILRKVNGDAFTPIGKCQYITSGSPESCFPESKRLRPTYPENIKMGKCELKDGFKTFVYTISFKTQSECELFPEFFVDGRVSFNYTHVLNYPKLTFPTEMAISRPFEHRPGIWGAGTTILDLNKKPIYYTLAKDAALDCGVVATANSELQWSQTDDQFPEYIFPDLWHKSHVRINGKIIPDSDRKSVQFREKVSGSGVWYPVTCGTFNDCSFVQPEVPLTCKVN